MLYQQPQVGPFEIDWGNPITKDLRFLSIESIPYDIVSRTLATAVGGAFTKETTPKGVGTRIANGSCAIVFGSSDATNITGPITCISIGVFDAIGADSTTISKCVSNGASNTPFDFGITAGGAVRLGRSNGSGYRVWAGAAPTTVSKLQMIAATQGGDIGVAPKFYINGVLDSGSATSLYGGAATGPAGGNSDPVRGNNRGDLSTPTVGLVLYRLVFARELTAAELASVYANVNQLLFDDEEYDFTPLAAGSSAGTATPTGVGAVASIGATTASGGAKALPSGGGATAAVGTALVSAGAKVSPLGIGSAASVGSPSASGGATAPPSGVTSTAAVGMPAAAGAGVASPVGVAAVATVGAGTASAGATASPAGVGTAATVGAAVATGAGAGMAAPAGVFAVATVGTAQVNAGAAASPAGVSALASVGAAVATGAGAGVAMPSGVTATATVGMAQPAAGAQAVPAGVAAYARIGVALASGNGPIVIPAVPSSRTVDFAGGSNRVDFAGGSCRVNFDGGTNRVNF